MAITEEEVLREVEKELELMKLGFTLSDEDRRMLDEPHLASKHMVLELEDRLPVNIKNELFRIANSPLYHKSGSEKAEDFWEVSQILGLANIKGYIFSSALFTMSATSKDILDLKRRSLATAGLSLAIMHNVLGFDLKTAPMVQLCALVSEFGKIPFFSFRQRNADNQELTALMTGEFINIHHGRFGMMMIKKYDLPEFLTDLFEKKSLIFFDQEHEFSVTTVVRIAKLLVRDSFKHHGKLVIKSVVDDRNGVVWGSVGTEIQSFFDTMEIGRLLEVIPHETPAQQYARTKKQKS